MQLPDHQGVRHRFMQRLLTIPGHRILAYLLQFVVELPHDEVLVLCHRLGDRVADVDNLRESTHPQARAASLMHVVSRSLQPQGSIGSGDRQKGR